MDEETETQNKEVTGQDYAACGRPLGLDPQPHRVRVWVLRYPSLGTRGWGRWLGHIPTAGSNAGVGGASNLLLSEPRAGTRSLKQNDLREAMFQCQQVYDICRQDGSMRSRPASPHSLKVISGKPSPGSGPQFPHLSCGDNK